MAVFLYLVSERKLGVFSKLPRPYSYYPLIFGKLENIKIAKTSIGLWKKVVYPNRVKPRSEVVRCQFWVERWRAAELYPTHREVIDIGFFGHSVFCLSEGSVDPAIGALWNMESIPLGSTEFCILPIELLRFPI